jgi:hypothetical protein
MVETGHICSANEPRLLGLDEGGQPEARAITTYRIERSPSNQSILSMVLYGRGLDFLLLQLPWYYAVQ